MWIEEQIIDDYFNRQIYWIKKNNYKNKKRKQFIIIGLIVLFIAFLILTKKKLNL